MLAIAIGIAMSVLDGAVANIALPAIAAEFHASPAESIWVVNAYQLAVVMALLPLASLGERIGYRRVYLWGLAIFTLGSVACALSQNMPELIVARVGQGVGAAGVFAVNGALVRFTYPRPCSAAASASTPSSSRCRRRSGRRSPRRSSRSGPGNGCSRSTRRSESSTSSSPIARCRIRTAAAGRSTSSARRSMRSPSACSSSAPTR